MAKRFNLNKTSLQKLEKFKNHKPITDEIYKTFFEVVVSAVKLIKDCSEKSIVDAGIGFGKNLSGNVSLIKKVKELCGGKYKILMALSRKSCIGEMTGRPVDERLSGTLAANLISVLNGASIVRVHDYNETIDILKVLSYIKP